MLSHLCCVGVPGGQESRKSYIAPTILWYPEQGENAKYPHGLGMGIW